MADTTKDDATSTLLQVTKNLAESASNTGSASYAQAYAQAARETAEAYRIIRETS